MTAARSSPMPLKATRRNLLATAVVLAGATQTRAAGVLVPSETPKAIADFSFQDEAGQATNLAAFRGRVILLNVWATWCVPCRKEMPTLDRLQAALGGPAFTVLPLSVDRRGIDRIRQFFAEIGIAHLGIYLDPTTQAIRTLGVPGLPTTLLLDRNGNELARAIGPAEWDSEEIQAVIRQTIG